MLTINGRSARLCDGSMTRRDLIQVGACSLLGLSLPQFFFHLTTAYDILRHAGVDIAKKDFLGLPR